MNYKGYSAEDFIMDEKFINWIKTGDLNLNAFWENWILSNPENKQAFMDARTLLLNLEFKKDEFTSKDKLELWNKIKPQVKGVIAPAGIIYTNDNENDKSGIKKADIIDSRRRSLIYQWRKIAAALIIFFTLAGVAYYAVNNREQLPVKVVIKDIIKNNPKGQKLTTYLPDGSKVVLNSLSSIKYKEQFTGSERIIELKGEAFIKVEKDATKPFKVISNGVIVIALGTSFNVNSKNDDYVEVSLVEGIVSVENAFSKSIILNPGKSAIVYHKGELKVQEFNYLDKAGWKDGILVFKNSAFPEVVTKLEDWYGVEINVVVGSKNQIQYTSNFQNESLGEILEGISFVYDFKYEINGKNVKIYFKNKNLPMK